jgi:hypothetical protein
MNPAIDSLYIPLLQPMQNKRVYGFNLSLGTIAALTHGAKENGHFSNCLTIAFSSLLDVAEG